MKSPAASGNLADLPVLKVLARARAEGRMPHAVLLTGADGTVPARAAEQLAALHLGEADPLSHPDCRVLRPAKKSRRITIDNTLEVVAALRLSSLSPHRVVIVNEPDRFQPDSANAFLKTLEEPPPGTLIILQTANYYRVLPTILSRCLRFHVAGDAPVLADPPGPTGCGRWRNCSPAWSRVRLRRRRVSEVFIPLYALCARLEVLLELFVDEALKAAPPPPPTDEDEDDAELAYEESVRRGVRARMLVSVEEKLRLIGRTHPGCAEQVALSVGYLEDARHRMELNYQVVAAFEQFLLRTLRAFALRPRAA